jgi:N-acetyltransferase
MSSSHSRRILCHYLTKHQFRMTQPTHLEGHFIQLQRLAPAHLNALKLIATEPLIWQHLPVEGWRDEVFWSWANDTLEAQMNRKAHVFAIFDRKTGAIIGTSRFQEMDRFHHRTEIGWTWFAPNYWGRGYNAEAKYLMLEFAFEVWQVQRVGFKVDERNRRSQRALENTGAQQEGFFRNHMIRPDGSRRNTFFYGITDEDWFSFAKNRLQNQVLDAILGQKHTAEQLLLV